MLGVVVDADGLKHRVDRFKANLSSRGPSEKKQVSRRNIWPVVIIAAISLVSNAYHLLSSGL